MSLKPFDQLATQFRAPLNPGCVRLRKLLRPELCAAKADLILQYILITLKARPRGAQYPEEM